MGICYGKEIYTELEFDYCPFHERCITVSPNIEVHTKDAFKDCPLYESEE